MSSRNLADEVIENNTLFTVAPKSGPNDSKLNAQMGHEYTLFKATVIPCGSEDQSEFSEEPYEIVLSRSNAT